MRKYFLLVAATAIFFLQTLAAEDFAPCTHTTKKSSDNYFGVGQFQLATPLFEDTAISVLGEIGPRSYRASGTIGAFYDCHRVKVGGEYLGQKMSYNFCTGNEKHWVQQYAVGGRYEYLVGCGWLRGLYLDGSSSYAQSKHLDTIEFITDITANHIETITDTVVRRHLAGSRYVNVVVGGEFIPWECANFLVGVGYNDIRFDTKVDCRHKNLQGFSADLEFVQRFCNNVVLDLTAQFRRPYTYAEAMIDWSYDTGCGMFTMGLFGGYVWGKSEIPNSTVAGLEIGFNFGPSCCTSSSYCCTSSSYCCAPSCYCGPCCAPSNDCQELIAWVNKPAVYMPTVLVAQEQHVTQTITQIVECTTPEFIGYISGPPYDNGDPYIVDTSVYFTGSPLLFSLERVYPGPDNLNATIDPVTGVVSISVINDYEEAGNNFIVVATNACGSAESNSFRYNFTPP